VRDEARRKTDGSEARGERWLSFCGPGEWNLPIRMRGEYEYWGWMVWSGLWLVMCLEMRDNGKRPVGWGRGTVTVTCSKEGKDRRISLCDGDYRRKFWSMYKQDGECMRRWALWTILDTRVV